MWSNANRIAKHWCPGVHQRLKNLSGSRLAQHFDLALPRLIAGHVVWTHPSLLSAPAPEEHIVRWVSRLLPFGGTFFDVGAHCGWITVTAAHQAGNAGKIVAFEGSPALVDLLAYHKRVNRFRQIEIVPKVVSELNAESVPFFLINRGLSFRNSLTIGADDAPYISTQEKTIHEVPSITIDRYVEESGDIPDVIKMDVEGAELLVLRGAERVLRYVRPYLIVGVHPYWLPKSQKAADIFDLLKELRYDVVDERTAPFDGGYLADYLCAPGRKSQ